MNSNYSIVLKDISKKYYIHHEKPTLVEKFVKKPDETFFALQNISLNINKGERIGIIGPNGSGKTTLLKIISGITAPTTGIVKIEGKIISLIDIEAGFHPDLTGIQNIYMNGVIIGMTRQEIDSKLDDIISFADIKQFIDVPLFTYSSGMKLRLGFAVAVHADPDILIVDEGFGAGDSNFQKKNLKKLNEFNKKGKTIIMVSHWLEFIEKNCERIITVEKGKITSDKKQKII